MSNEKEETVWVDDGGDFMKSVRGDQDLLDNDMREFVEGMLKTPHAYFVLAMELKTAAVTFTSNVPIDLQLEMLQNAIDNLKRVGQKA